MSKPLTSQTQILGRLDAGILNLPPSKQKTNTTILDSFVEQVTKLDNEESFSDFFSDEEATTPRTARTDTLEFGGDPDILEIKQAAQQLNNTLAELSKSLTTFDTKELTTQGKDSLQALQTTILTQRNELTKISARCDQQTISKTPNASLPTNKELEKIKQAALSITKSEAKTTLSQELSKTNTAASKTLSNIFKRFAFKIISIGVSVCSLLLDLPITDNQLKNQKNTQEEQRVKQEKTQQLENICEKLNTSLAPTPSQSA